MGRNGTKLGQNFLVDETGSRRIADALGDVHDRTVVEIGPGHGAITTHLATRCARLHLVEFDPSLARELQFRFRNDSHLSVDHADILRTDLARFLPAADPASKAPRTLDIVGNLPYYITSDILLHLFAAAREGVVQRAVLMTQREVADRLAAEPGSSDYGALSALTHLHATVTTLFTLPPAAFSPPPEVYSTVFRLDFAPRFTELGIDFAGFNPFLRSTFAQKRKTLVNNLRNAGYDAATLQAAWPDSIPAQARAEAVPLESLAGLYRGLGSPST